MVGSFILKFQLVHQEIGARRESNPHAQDPRDGALHHLSLPIRVCQIEGFGVSNVRYPQAHFNRLAMAVLEAE
jgi:hypothetical protein